MVVIYIVSDVGATAPVILKVSAGLFKNKDNTKGEVIEIGVPVVAPEGSSGMQYLYVYLDN